MGSKPVAEGTQLANPAGLPGNRLNMCPAWSSTHQQSDAFDTGEEPASLACPDIQTAVKGQLSRWDSQISSGPPMSSTFSSRLRASVLHFSVVHCQF